MYTLSFLFISKKVICTYLHAGSISVEAHEINWKYIAGKPLAVSELQQKAQSKCRQYDTSDKLHMATKKEGRRMKRGRGGMQKSKRRGVWERRSKNIINTSEGEIMGRNYRQMGLQER